MRQTQGEIAVTEKMFRIETLRNVFHFILEGQYHCDQVNKNSWYVNVSDMQYS